MLLTSSTLWGLRVDYFICHCWYLWTEQWMYIDRSTCVFYKEVKFLFRHIEYKWQNCVKIVFVLTVLRVLTDGPTLLGDTVIRQSDYALNFVSRSDSSIIDTVQYCGLFSQTSCSSWMKEKNLCFTFGDEITANIFCFRCSVLLSTRKLVALTVGFAFNFSSDFLLVVQWYNNKYCLLHLFYSLLLAVGSSCQSVINPCML